MTKFKNVLLVEDDPITILVCERIIKINHFAENVVSKSNGLEGLNFILNLIETNQPLPDIIFLDINMPIMNGWDFLNELAGKKNLVNKIPVVYILSSTVDPEDFKKAESYECVKKTISKPLTTSILDQINP